ncbi:MAG: hypothetical protein QOI79_137, partial [Mycobacterium sp.]|nr:hypothetical protein [Mycobacterium sp.]
PAPPLGDVHLENPEGIGPNLPLNVHGLPSTDPLAQIPLIDLGGAANSPQTSLPWQQRPGPPAASCTVICIGQETGAPQQTFNTPPTGGLAPLAPASAGLLPALMLPAAPLAPLPAGPPAPDVPPPAAAPAVPVPPADAPAPAPAG